jgi:NodT family efflux transporter outer membrane factor (OMF) lipoprotein
MHKLRECFKTSMMIAAFIMQASCAVGPDYVRPVIPVPEKFKEAKNKKIFDAKQNKQWKIAEPKDCEHRGEWWRIFHDKELNKLEARLNASNQTVMTAAANYRQARALVDEARASFFPTVTGSLSMTHQKGSGSSSFVSTSSTGSTTTGIATSGTTGSIVSSSHSWLLDASWEPDIWGLVRRQVEASFTGAQASAALLGATQLSAQGSLAQYYFQLRALDSDQKFLNDTVKSYKKALQITRNQYKSGTAARSDIVQAQSQFESAQALAINNGINRAIYEHAIAVLIGEAPANLSIPFKTLKQVPPPIPVTVPSILLERRPDIAQAERLMAQANAQIGVAKAAYYPTIALTASANSSARNAGLAQLFQFPTIGWAYGPQLTQLIFDGGLRNATVAAAYAGYDSTVASYRQVVLTAFQDVEDNLSTLRILNEQAVKQNQAAASARFALKLVLNQYQAGIVVYSSVITAQITAFAAEKSAIDVTGLRMTAAVGLIKALGGSWEDTANYETVWSNQ